MTADTVIEVRESTRDELNRFVAMETDAETARYILPYSLAQHESEFERGDIIYLTILRAAAAAGFFILALDEDRRSVEFRRIVVADKGRGIGQQAIFVMEAYCRETLKRQRIWLDVFAHNRRGRHIYQKLGYSLFDRGELNGEPLLFMHKSLGTAGFV